MTNIVLQARARTALGKANNALRKAGTLPAVLYGHGIAAQQLAVTGTDFQRVYRAAGESTLVDLSLDGGKPVKVIIQGVQRHPITGLPIHIDFLQVRMTEKIHTEIPLNFIGEALAVKELGGVLVKNLDHVRVQALPGDLVHEIPVEVSSLKTFDDILHVSDLHIPNGIEVLDLRDAVVCVVTPPRSEAELAELETKVEEQAAVEAVEGVKPAEEPATGEGAADQQVDAKASDRKEKKEKET